MKRSSVPSSILACWVVMLLDLLSPGQARAQGLAGTPEMKAKQAGIEKDTPQLAINDEVLYFFIPGQTMGQTVGVSRNSKLSDIRSAANVVYRGSAILWQVETITIK